MDRPPFRHNDQLGVNKIGKKIKKNANGIAPARPQPQPQVYYIRKNDFKSIVQQPTGSPLPETLPQPPILTQQPHVVAPVIAHPSHNLARPPMLPLPHGSKPMMGHGDQFLSNTAESPVSMYMHHLQSSLGYSESNGNQMEPYHEYQTQPPVQAHTQPQSNNHHSPRFNGSVSSVPILPSPRFNGPPQQMYNNLPSPRFNGRGILPSPPTSQYLLQSPTGYQSLLSPRSPYPLPSAGVRYPPPLTPRSFTSSSMSQPGILGPVTFPQRPFGVFPSSSPRKRDK